MLKVGTLVDAVGWEAGTLVDAVVGWEDGMFGGGTLVDAGIYVAPAWLETCSIELRSLSKGKKY